jgi:hypothetical protein
MTTFTTEDRIEATRKTAQWELAYADWVNLLNTANAKGLLQDPSACFDEGWRQASMTAMATVQQILGNTNPDLIRILEKRLLK